MRSPCSGYREPTVPRQWTPSQVAGALIPDNTQHSWRDDVGKVSKVLASRGD